MFKDRLKAARKTRGLTQKEAAIAVGASVGNFSKWERGVVKPSFIFLEKLQDYFGPSLMVHEENDENQIPETQPLIDLEPEAQELVTES